MVPIILPRTRTRRYASSSCRCTQCAEMRAPCRRYSCGENLAASSEICVEIKESIASTAQPLMRRHTSGGAAAFAFSMRSFLDYVRLACLDQAFGDEATAEFVREGTRSYFGQREATILDERPLSDGGQYDSRYALMWRLRRLVWRACCKCSAPRCCPAVCVSQR